LRVFERLKKQKPHADIAQINLGINAIKRDADIHEPAAIDLAR
jgi:hypothetical protein